MLTRLAKKKHNKKRINNQRSFLFDLSRMDHKEIFVDQLKKISRKTGICPIVPAIRQVYYDKLKILEKEIYNSRLYASGDLLKPYVNYSIIIRKRLNKSESHINYLWFPCSKEDAEILCNLNPKLIVYHHLHEQLTLDESATSKLYTIEELSAWKIMLIWYIIFLIMYALWFIYDSYQWRKYYQKKKLIPNGNETV